MNKTESLHRKLTFGISYLLSSSIASILINAITVGFIARKLGVENFGLYSAILSFVQLFQFLSDFGLNKTLLRFGSTDIAKAQTSFGNALFVKSILILPTLFLLTVLGLIAGYRDEKLIVLELFAVSLILDSYATIFTSVRRILGSFKLISFFRVFRTIANLIIIVIALSYNNSVLSLATANTALSIVTFIVSLLNTLLLLKPKIKLELIKDFFKDSIIFSLSDFFLNLYSRIGTVLLSFFNELHSVGIYSAAAKFTRIANLVPTQVQFALLPTMYRILDENNVNKPKKVFTILLKYMAIFATPLAISIYFFSESFIHLIFGQKYDLAIPLVKLFSLFIYLRFIETPFNLFYIGLKKHKNMVIFQGITSVLNIVLNLVLIPLYSAYGACFATLISETTYTVMIIFTGRKYSLWKSMEILKILLKTIFATYLSLILVNTLLFKANLFIQQFVMITSYFLLLFLVKAFNKEDKELFLKIFVAKEKKTMENL